MLVSPAQVEELRARAEELSTRFGWNVEVVDRDGFPRAMLRRDFPGHTVWQSFEYTVRGDVHRGDVLTHSTLVTIRLPHGKPTPRFVLYPERSSDRFAKLLWMQDIDIGDPAIDDRFILQSTLSTANVALVLAPDVRRTLLDFHPLGVGVTAGESSLELAVLCWVVSERRIESMLNLAWRLAEGLRPDLFKGSRGRIGPPSPAPPVLHLTETAGADPGCRVCGHALDGEVVRCAACERPHHRACWDYAGRCSTYGCGSVSTTGGG